MNFWTQSEKNIYVAGHRGMPSRYPENTLPSFQACLDLVLDQIEFDVRSTKDFELVVIHDDTVDRTTNGTGRVCDMTLDEIRALDAGSWKGEEFKGEKIPTLTEVMELVKNHPTITLDIELKEYPDDHFGEKAYEIADRILEIVDEYGFADRVVINSFSYPLNEYIAKKYGHKYRQHVYYPMHAMCGKLTRSPYEYAYCACMFMGVKRDINLATRSECDIMRDLGPQPWAGACICDERGVDLAIESGVTLITCNNPDEILEILRKKGLHK